MATNRAMLKEAIADAKAVKETAIANAKAALEEAFTPQLKSMLSMKLQEMEVEEDDYVTDKTEHDDKPYSTKKAADVAGYLEEEDTMMEVDLEELLAELGKEDEVEEGLYEAEETEEEENSEEEETEDEGEPIDLEDMTDDDLKSMIEDVIADMIKSGELEAGHEGEEEEMDMDMDMEMEPEDEEVEGEEEVNLEELLKEIEGLEEEEYLKEEEYLDEEETTPSKELEEAYSTIETLKSELNEINLLNAKLLYTNKIFKSKTLNESQKVKVLSSFDKAKNVGEVKMVFETLNEGIKVSKNTINENLGRASKGTMTPNVKKPIVESNEAFLRMQKLAGII
jgi:hypothetical protein